MEAPMAAVFAKNPRNVCKVQTARDDRKLPPLGRIAAARYAFTVSSPMFHDGEKRDFADESECALIHGDSARVVYGREWIVNHGDREWTTLNDVDHYFKHGVFSEDYYGQVYRVYHDTVDHHFCETMTEEHDADQDEESPSKFEWADWGADGCGFAFTSVYGLYTNWYSNAIALQGPLNVSLTAGVQLGAVPIDFGFTGYELSAVAKEDEFKALCNKISAQVTEIRSKINAALSPTAALLP